MPRNEGGEGGRVEDSFALQAVESAGASGEVTVEHAECAGLEVAQDGARCGLDPARAQLEVGARRRREGEVNGNVKRLVLARGKAALQVLGVGQGGSERGVGGAGV